MTSSLETTLIIKKKKKKNDHVNIFGKIRPIKSKSLCLKREIKKIIRSGGGKLGKFPIMH